MDSVLFWLKKAEKRTENTVKSIQELEIFSKYVIEPLSVQLPKNVLAVHHKPQETTSLRKIYEEVLNFKAST
jgi:hypothetical protein